MKAQYLLLTVLVSPLTLLAQFQTSASSARAPLASSATTQVMTLSGKIRVQGDAAPNEMTSVVLQCGGQERARANADREGQFSLTVPAEAPVVTNRTGVNGSQNESGAGLSPTPQLKDCELYADAPGYQSERIQLFAMHDSLVQVGVITLHPLASSDSNTISVTSLQAPENARKNFEKGQQQAKKNKWAAACEYFKRAIEAYPRYALAWAELGRAQARQNDFADAQVSLHKAVEQDSHLMQGYVDLARLALQRSDWKELAAVTARMVQLAPDYSAQYWFLNSAANYNLGQMPAAETSAARGLRLDQIHQFPQLEYLYAMILANRHDYQSAATHLQSYLHLAPPSKETQDAQNKLIELQKLAPFSTSPANSASR